MQQEGGMIETHIPLLECPGSNIYHFVFRIVVQDKPYDGPDELQRIRKCVQEGKSSESSRQLC